MVFVPSSRPQTGRRNFIRLGALAIGGTVGAAALPGTTRWAGAEEPVDYTSRATFDEWDRLFVGTSNGQPDQPNDNSDPRSRSGMLAWGQSYVLQGLIRMFETYGDDHYLNRLIENIDQVLLMRDSDRGVTDYRGLSLPAWRAEHPYTVGFTTLNDDQGRPTLEVRSAKAYANSVTTTVLAGTTPGTFTLRIFSGQYQQTATVADLTMDPTSANYAVRRFYASSIGSLMLTVRDVRQTPNDAGNPTQGEFPMLSAPAIFAVHTGMISYPIAAFGRIVLRDPRLRADARYRQKAEEYLAAAQAAVAVHDHEYRESAHGAGHLIWPKGMPLAWDGCEQPINQSLGLAQTVVEIAAATGDARARQRATAYGRMLTRQLTTDDGDAASWHYWPTNGLVYDGFTKTGAPATDVSLFTPEPINGRGSQQYEDISHGAISVEFAARAFQERLGISNAVMTRLGRTFTQNVAATSDGLPDTHRTVAGTGLGGASVSQQVPRWMPVAPWDSRVHKHSLALYNRFRPTPEKDGTGDIGFGWLLANVAYLNWGGRRAR